MGDVNFALNIIFLSDLVEI